MQCKPGHEVRVHSYARVSVVRAHTAGEKQQRPSDENHPNNNDDDDDDEYSLDEFDATLKDSGVDQVSDAPVANSSSTHDVLDPHWVIVTTPTGWLAEVPP
jgi:hypothetical protein